MKTSILRRKIPSQADDLQELSPILQRIYRARQVKSKKELSYSLQHMNSFNTLLGIDKAVSRLVQALQLQEQIVIVGDFDVDGATSTALAVSALTQMGFLHVSYLIPDRFIFGYGLTPELVNLACERFNPALMITVDNGISSHLGVICAREKQIDVIITDHHLPGESLPHAFAVVNPNQPGDLHPSKCLAGVGVIFYVMLALRAHLNEQGWFEQQGKIAPNMAQFLDLVALGTVADVVPLDASNRLLVHQGLQRIRTQHTRPGIEALFTVADRSPKNASVHDLGFSLGPRLNAAGRLEDMSLGVACLLEMNELAALNMARQLDALNQERRAIESEMQYSAFAAVERLNLSKKLPRGLCLFEESWHQGVVGLVASRVKDKTYRPVIAFARADESYLKGSARSVPGLHLRETLASIDEQYPGLINKFGGHAMAAGLTILSEDYHRFSEIFALEVSKHLSEEDLHYQWLTDGDLKSDEFSLELAQLLKTSGPWGQGFPEPVFDGEFLVLNQRIVGDKHLKLTLQVPDRNFSLDAIAFNIDLNDWPNHRCQRVHLVYRLGINEYQGVRKLQLVVDKIWSDVMPVQAGTNCIFDISTAV